MNLTQAQWHMVAAADDIIKCGGQIVGVVLGGVEHYFSASRMVAHLPLTPSEHLWIKYHNPLSMPSLVALLPPWGGLHDKYGMRSKS